VAGKVVVDVEEVVVGAVDDVVSSLAPDEQATTIIARRTGVTVTRIMCEPSIRTGPVG
jgi:hypothetical protein